MKNILPKTIRGWLAVLAWLGLTIALILKAEIRFEWGYMIHYYETNDAGEVYGVPVRELHFQFRSDKTGNAELTIPPVAPPSTGSQKRIPAV